MIQDESVECVFRSKLGVQSPWGLVCVLYTLLGYKIYVLVIL